MKLDRAQRLNTALLLFSLVLLSTFACALGHGQSSGLLLSGISELTCSVTGGDSPQAPAQPNTGPNFNCPICSSGGLPPIATNGWGPDLPQWLPSVRHSTTPHPLHLLSAEWPAASPRAPPAHS
jgi:hypothetical protein